MCKQSLNYKIEKAISSKNGLKKTKKKNNIVHNSEPFSIRNPKTQLPNQEQPTTTPNFKIQSSTRGSVKFPTPFRKRTRTFIKKRNIRSVHAIFSAQSKHTSFPSVLVCLFCEPWKRQQDCHYMQFHKYLLRDAPVLAYITCIVYTQTPKADIKREIVCWLFKSKIYILYIFNAVKVWWTSTGSSWKNVCFMRLLLLFIVILYFE